MTSESTLADLTASCRRTSGEKPPALVGASCSLVSGSSGTAKLFVFGGRLVPKRVLVADLYALDLSTLVWTKLWPPPDARVVEFNADSAIEELAQAGKEGPGEDKALRGPQARYFHSADVHGDLIYFWGGMGNQPPPPPRPGSSASNRPASPALSVSSRTSKGSRTSKRSKKSVEMQQQQSPNPEETPFCVLNDLIIYNTNTNTWQFPTPTFASSTPNFSDGQSPSFSQSPQPASPAARYAHLSCITNNCLIILGGQSLTNQYIQEINVLDLERMIWIETRRFEGQVGTYRSVLASRPVTLHSGSHGSSGNSSKRKSLLQEAAKTSYRNSQGSIPDQANLVQLSYASPPDMEPLWLFSNFSFTNVKRSLSMLSAPRPPHFASPVSHLSHLMSGSVLPPGLRFPSGSVVGNHLIITGTFLSHTSSSFAIWALDLSAAPKGGKLSWQKIDPGAIMSHGASWNRCVPFHDRNSLIILGNRDRDIAADYEHRQINFDHVAFVDLEAFGIYAPPLRVVPPLAQEMGLASLAQPGDFEIVCADGKRLSCSRKMLETRWSWFADRMSEFKGSSRHAFRVLSNTNPATSAQNGDSETPTSASGRDKELTDIRISPRSLHLPEPSQVVFAALQYFYTLSLCTPLQQQVNVLVGLLLFSKTYHVLNLRALVCHALHGCLSQGGSVAATIYEASTLAGANALQIRSLKRMMISSARRHQPSKSTGSEAKK